MLKLMKLECTLDLSFELDECVTSSHASKAIRVVPSALRNAASRPPRDRRGLGSVGREAGAAPQYRLGAVIVKRRPLPVPTTIAAPREIKCERGERSVVRDIPVVFSLRRLTARLVSCPGESEILLGLTGRVSLSQQPPHAVVREDPNGSPPGVLQGSVRQPGSLDAVSTGWRQ